MLLTTSRTLCILVYILFSLKTDASLNFMSENVANFSVVGYFSRLLMIERPNELTTSI